MMKLLSQRLELTNIGHIKETNIDISGLTIIAGKNGTGKSTIGKVLMADIKANNMASDIYRKNIQENIANLHTKYFTF